MKRVLLVEITFTDDKDTAVDVDTLTEQISEALDRDPNLTDKLTWTEVLDEEWKGL